MVTVTIKKIDNTWWYNACEKCMRTAKTYGDLYKCAAGHIGKPVQRYKLTIIAGDETGDTNFIMFGRWVQRLTKKTNKKIAKKLLLDEDPDNEDDTCADDTAKPS